MSVTFLIGNGFDLNCGLKTSYNDIYREYIKQPSASEIISRFKDDLWRDIENWGDFETAMAGYMNHFSSEDEFLECIRDFVSFTEKHLSEQETIIDLTDNRIENAARDEMLRSFKCFYKGITHTLDRLINGTYSLNAIVYNYTSVFDKLFLLCQNDFPYSQNIVHIHGKLNDDMIMGMDNIDQIKLQKYTLSRRGRRAFIKSEFNEQYDPYRMNKAEKMISESNIICVYGMSLGDSDLRWRNLLLKKLEEDKGFHLFLYQFDCSKLGMMRAEQRLCCEEDKKSLILKSWGIEDVEAEKYFENIHIPCCKNIFNVGQVIAEEKLRIIAEERVRKEKAPRLVMPTNLNR